MNELMIELTIIEELLADYNDAGYKTDADGIRCDVSFAKERLAKLIIKYQREIIVEKRRNSRVPFGMRSH